MLAFGVIHVTSRCESRKRAARGGGADTKTDGSTALLDGTAREWVRSNMDSDASKGPVGRRAFLKQAGRIGAALAGMSALSACGATHLNRSSGVASSGFARDDGLEAAFADDGEPHVDGAPRAAERVITPSSHSEVRTLTLRHKWSDEYVTAVFRRGGDYDREALQVINYIMRDRHDEAVVPIDIRLVELLADLQADLAPNEAIDVLSGYRTPRTNYRLRRRNRAAARNSLHMRAMAVDLRIDGVSTRELRDWGVGRAYGGVGYYPRRRFVHLDVGDVRYWRY